MYSPDLAALIVPIASQKRTEVPYHKFSLLEPFGLTLEQIEANEE